MKFKAKVDIDVKNFGIAYELIDKETANRIRDIGDSLALTSSGAAPHDEGILEKSYKVELTKRSATVSFSAFNNGCDYAVKMHDGVYNLGPGSRAKPGGIGMSGKHYSVGPKYLSRPLEGEAETYAKYVNDGIGNILDSFE
ncbi:hypothetical protein H1164_08250 [Thermoactinomyces daqus]|uniref:HK97 gp10 family phage protein n=1 Tax=Thermoactinomyces daqus TaxID=1329516 RepID=A0A7W1XA93_9BACL|nr:hypothetical protein [Thermoactinomyces daqus]MBA4542891.1 hypothetical protein [Thermoactinomyces daqus]